MLKVNCGTADVLIGVKPVNDPTVVELKDLYTVRQNTVSEALNLSVTDVDSSGIVAIHLKVKHGFLHLATVKPKACLLPQALRKSNY